MKVEKWSEIGKGYTNDTKICVCSNIEENGPNKG